MTTMDRLLREHGGDAARALEHACRTIDYLSGRTSVGYMRAGPTTDRAAKQYVEGILLPDDDSPHG
jgi:hypothetical protein